MTPTSHRLPGQAEHVHLTVRERTECAAEHAADTAARAEALAAIPLAASGWTA